MIEKVYKITKSDKHLVEKVLRDDLVQIMHVVLDPMEGFHPHHSNANLYLTVVRGKFSIKLDEQELHIYEAGTVLNIPEGIFMKIDNLEKDQVLEFTVLKTPPPKE